MEPSAPFLSTPFSIARQIVCGNNCAFVINAQGGVFACGDGSGGKLGLGNSEDHTSLTAVSALRGK